VAATVLASSAQNRSRTPLPEISVDSHFSIPMRKPLPSRSAFLIGNTARISVIVHLQQNTISAVFALHCANRLLSRYRTLKKSATGRFSAVVFSYVKVVFASDPQTPSLEYDRLQRRPLSKG